MTSCPEARGWEFCWFLKKAVSWHSTMDEVSWDSDLGEARPAEIYGMHRTFVGSVSWDWTLGGLVQLGTWLKDDAETVSLVKIVSLSSCRKTKNQTKVNKRFVPELKLWDVISIWKSFSKPNVFVEEERNLTVKLFADMGRHSNTLEHNSNSHFYFSNRLL